MRKKNYEQPDFVYLLLKVDDVLGASATITDDNGDHLQPWSWE